MKKVLAILLALATLLVFAGCAKLGRCPRRRRADIRCADRHFHADTL